MDLGTYPDREYFWDLVFTIKPKWEKQLVQEVTLKRNLKANKVFDKKVILITDKWFEKLSSADINRSKSIFIYNISIGPVPN